MPNREDLEELWIQIIRARDIAHDFGNETLVRLLDMAVLELAGAGKAVDDNPAPDRRTERGAPVSDPMGSGAE